MTLVQNVAILFFFGFAFVVGLLAEYIPNLLIKRKPTPEKLAPFESGEDSVGGARVRFKAHYYIFAVAFITFDVVAVLAIPWATSWNMINWNPVLLLFVSLLVVVFYYSLKGDLEWV